MVIMRILIRDPLKATCYYCKSRYYVVEWCRWLNGDSIEYLKAENINGMNLFNYCQNIPIMKVDENGNWGRRDILGRITGIIVSAVITAVAITLGVATGGIAGVLIAGSIGFSAGFTSSVVEQSIAKGEIDFSRAALEGVISGICTATTARANGSGIMTQTGFIERTIETCTSDLLN